MKGSEEDNNVLIDALSLTTLDEETGEICCPNCGSWTNLDDLRPGMTDTSVATCPMCQPAS